MMATIAGGAVAALSLPAVAGAVNVAPDPQTTNIPYTAWSGEQLRLVKCDPALRDAANGDLLIESWSGSPDTRPQLEFSTARFFTGRNEMPCASADVASLGSGLARIKFVASDGSGDPILKHQFLAIWMTFNDPVIHEIAASDPTGGPAGSANEVGDPAGDGSFTAGSRNGRAQVTVTGSFPFRGGVATLPNDWPTLAGQLAVSDSADPSGDAKRWDIHDDQLMTEGHVAGFCNPITPVAIDAVDNCRGGGDSGPFSNVFGQGQSPANGPFDPLRRATLLSDGKLDPGDAPMPAARVDFTIAPNTGATGDISGVGLLAKADKSNVYSRNGNGATDTSAHNLYAPYYKQWIPATSAPASEASGVDGPASGNDFAGFLVDGLYDNWDIARTLASAVPTNTSCNRTIGNPRTTPSGAQSVVVYTDEHGEAQVQFKPYASGFFFDSLPVVLNANRGCDLQDVGVLGTAAIRATVRYPYQPVDDPARTSAPLTKTVRNLFNKSLSYYPKGPGAANNNVRIVVAHANDIDGTPFAGERVCFYLTGQASGATGFTGTVQTPSGPLTVGGSEAGFDGPNSVCRTLDANGNAAIEVFASGGTVDVVGRFVDEGLIRDVLVNFATVGSTGSSSPSGPFVPTGSPAGGGGPTVVALAQAFGSSLPDSVVKSATRVSKAKTRVALSRIVRDRLGTRWLVVRVNSSKKSARIKVRMLGANRRLIRSTVRSVKTNQKVRVLKVGSSAKTVKVALAG
jgi:hypothetical protein